MTTRCDISDKNFTFSCFPNCTVSRCQAGGGCCSGCEDNKNKCSRKIASKELTLRHYSALNFLCFPSFLLDKISQPTPYNYKGH